MADRIIGMRHTLKDLLINKYGSKRNWDHITNQVCSFYSMIAALTDVFCCNQIGMCVD